MNIKIIEMQYFLSIKQRLLIYLKIIKCPMAASHIQKPKFNIAPTKLRHHVHHACSSCTSCLFIVFVCIPQLETIPNII